MYINKHLAMISASLENSFKKFKAQEVLRSAIRGNCSAVNLHWMNRSHLLTEKDMKRKIKEVALKVV